MEVRHLGAVKAGGAVAGPRRQRVRLENDDTATGGQIVFLASPGGTPADSIELDVPARAPTGPTTSSVGSLAGSNADGGVGFASTTDGDAVIRVTDVSNGSVIRTESLMVRIRKNANGLTPAERDRFLTALVTLNQQGNFVDFQNMHTADTSMEIHGRSCFLPWHRLYLLDLERKLQAIDPSVVLPYWRFDGLLPTSSHGISSACPIRPGSCSSRAPTHSSTGSSPSSVRAVDGSAGHRCPTSTRRPSRPHPEQRGGDAQPRDHARPDARDRPGHVREVRADGGRSAWKRPRELPRPARRHRRAPADPLFFLLHANVDRLWAKWQWLQDRAEPDDDRTYHKQGLGPNNPDPRRANADRIGNYLDDSLWPWCGLVGDPRPRTAPGTYFPRISVSARPQPLSADS